MGKKLILCCLLFGISNLSFAYIANILSWEKDGQVVMGCGDVHCQNPYAANLAQRRFLVDHLRLLNRNETAVLVEDANAYSGKSTPVRKFVKLRGTALPHDNLIAHVHAFGIDAVNIEYHFARAAALCPFVQYGEDTLITAHDVVKEFDSAVAQIRLYQDSDPMLVPYYKEQLAAVCDQNSYILGALRQYREPLTQWIRTQVSPKMQLTFGQKLRIWDARLLDPNALHAIVQRPQLRKILIFGGALHVDYIGRALVGYCGYKKRPSIGADRESHYCVPSLAISALKPYVAPSADLTHIFPPLPAEQLSVLFE